MLSLLELQVVYHPYSSIPKTSHHARPQRKVPLEVACKATQWGHSKGRGSFQLPFHKARAGCSRYLEAFNRDVGFFQSLYRDRHPHGWQSPTLGTGSDLVFCHLSSGRCTTPQCCGQNLSREERIAYHRLFSERYEELLHHGNGSCLLRHPDNASLVHHALQHFNERRYVLDEYVVMPNHVHVLVKPLPDHALANILHSWKSYTANQLNRCLGRTGKLWQHESYDHIVRNDAAMQAVRRYIRENPSK